MDLELYAQWLDGAWWKAHESHRADQLHVLRALKTRALLGQTVILSDVQTFDSGAIQKAFRDPGLQAFASRHHWFMNLASRPPGEQGAGSVNELSPFDYATAGLIRTQASGWRSSSPVDTDAMKAFAEKVLELGRIPTPDEASKGLKFYENTRLDQFASHFDAILFALGHFSSDRAHVRQLGGTKSTSYYSELIVLRDELARSSDLCGLSLEARRPIVDDLQRVNSTIRFVEEVCKHEDELHRRSIVESQLAARPEVNREQIWNTVVEAWNFSVSKSLGAVQLSRIPLPEAVSPARYFGHDVDVVELSSGRFRRAVDIRIPEPSWDEINKIVRDTGETRRAIWRSEPADLYKSLQDHVRNIKRHPSLRGKPTRSRLLWEIAAGMLPGSLGAGILLSAAIGGTHMVASTAPRLLGRQRLYNTLVREAEAVAKRGSH